MDKAEFYREARTDLTGPLAGVRVLEATTTWAGPMCGAILADLGADVIKVEIPGGEVSRRIPPMLPGTSVSFAHGTVNRNKRGLTLDIRRPEGRDIFLRLAARSDVVVENFKAGTLDGWGLGYGAVRKVKHDIVYVSITGWGQFGPYHERPGYDPFAQATSGFISLNGSPEGPPTKAPTFLGDDLGGLHGAIGAIAALRHRERTGEGQHVDVALLDSLLFQSNGLPSLAAMGVEPGRMGNQFGFAVPVNVFDCKDGPVYAGVLLDSHWKVLARVIGYPELADDPSFATLSRRVENRDACNAIFGAWLADRTRTEAIAALARSGIPIAPVNTYGDAARDPHVQERDILQPTRLEDGSTAPIVGPAAKFSRTPTRVRTGAPALGAHNEEILAELGIDAATRKRLAEAKVI
jgi:crotonobetainyl-CoA:carnitine CoA-transferase CaiB-like acyl-CoA transferase